MASPRVCVSWRLTPPSSGRPKGRFAPFAPPLMSNVRPPKTMGKLLITLLLLASACVAQAKVCSKAEARAAEATATTLKTWARIHAAFHRYSHCDDGAIAEGFTESVVHLLATRWSALPQAQRLITRDRAFGAFVVRHVDPSANRRELRLVAEYSAKRCPAGAAALCAKLRKAAIGR